MVTHPSSEHVNDFLTDDITGPGYVRVMVKVIDCDIVVKKFEHMSAEKLWTPYLPNLGIKQPTKVDMSLNEENKRNRTF